MPPSKPQAIALLITDMEPKVRDQIMNATKDADTTKVECVVLDGETVYSIFIG